MADLSEYREAAERGFNAWCEQEGIPRQLIDDLVAAKRAAEAEYWAREDAVMGAIRKDQRPGESFMEAWARQMGASVEVPRQVRTGTES